jgi:hypothetical protein
MEFWELVARERIRDTMAAYTHNGDRGRVAEMAATFCEDGILDIVGQEPLRGREAIVSLLSGAVERGSGAGFVRHFVTNLRFDELTPERARTSSYFLVMTADGPDHWGRYRDELVPSGDRWLFTRRTVRVDAAPDTRIFQDQ